MENLGKESTQLAGFWVQTSYDKRNCLSVSNVPPLCMSTPEVIIFTQKVIHLTTANHTVR